MTKFVRVAWGICKQLRNESKGTCLHEKNIIRVYQSELNFNNYAYLPFKTAVITILFCFVEKLLDLQLIWKQGNVSNFQRTF